MEAQKKRTQRDYTQAFKLAVVEQVEKGELSYKEAQRRYGIQGRSTVLVWLRKHGRQDWSAAAAAKTTMGNQPGKPKPLTPEQRIKELEVQLREAQEKARLFEAVIDVIQKEHGVRVVKKPSGRSLRKSSSKG
nr:transposase [Ralstonia solanacearum]